MRPLDATNAAAITSTVTSPHWFVRMHFENIIRLTTSQSVTWSAQGGGFVQADLSVDLSETPVVRVFNEGLSFGVTVLTDGTAGRDVSIWQAYKDPNAVSTLPGFAEPVLLFEGVMDSATIGDDVVIRCQRNPRQFSPRSYVREPVFNHLPRRGMVIEMPNQKITLE